MSGDIFGYVRNERPWDPGNVKDVTITLRAFCGAYASERSVTYNGIDGMQFHPGYAVVIMPNKSAYIYPYAMIEEIKCAKPFDTSPEARQEAIDKFRELNKVERLTPAEAHKEHHE